jgi:hypothetical protein
LATAAVQLKVESEALRLKFAVITPARYQLSRVDPRSSACSLSKFALLVSALGLNIYESKQVGGPLHITEMNP